MFKSVGLVARYDKKEAIKLAEDLAEYLMTKGRNVCLEETLSDKIHAKVQTVPLEEMKTDLIITIGGDGTILRTCILTPKPEPPILAINMGVRGFLAEIEPKQAQEAVDKCLKGQYRMERCMKLAAEADGTVFPDALNEVVITHSEPAKLLYTQILKDNEPILTCQADSLILSTQTGSTGYSLSAGGPVLDQSVDAFVLTPICPLTDFRPIVFPADSKITVRVLKPKEMLAFVDGQNSRIVKSRLPSIIVTRSKNVTSFIRFKENFYHRLESRLIFRGVG